jgi:hypothetical protein
LGKFGRTVITGERYLLRYIKEINEVRQRLHDFRIKLGRLENARVNQHVRSGPGEDDSFEARVAEVGSVQTCVAEIGTDQHCPTEIGLLQMGSTEIGSLQMQM